MTRAKAPVVFIHGPWLHASSWEPWTGLFEAAGYDATAPGWPGVPDTVTEARKHPESQAGLGIAGVAAHYARIAGAARVKPIVIGHSVGGLIAQILLGQDLAAAAVAIDPAPLNGVLAFRPVQLRAALPLLRHLANPSRPVSLTATQFRYVFGNALSQRESGQLFDAWTIPAPSRAVFEAACASLTPHSAAKVDTRNAARGPLLLISGLQDHAVPDAVTYSAYRRYWASGAVTDLERIAGRGHSLTIDSGWRQVAETILNWLDTRSQRRVAVSARDRNQPDHPPREPGGWGLYWPNRDGR